jgi:hypothetical protein
LPELYSVVPLRPNLQGRLGGHLLRSKQMFERCETIKLSVSAKLAMIDQHQLLLKNIFERFAYFQRMLFTEKHL